MLSKILNEPLLHFFALGLLMFFFLGTSGEQKDPPPDNEIRISKNIEEELNFQFKATRKRLPTDIEFSELLENFVREEILVREALKLNLDNNDQAIRIRLREKLESIDSATVQISEPTSDELLAFFREHELMYATGGQVSFEQIFIGQSPVKKVINATRKVIESNASPETIGKPSSKSFRMIKSTKRAVNDSFGPAFFTALLPLKIDAWSGPIKSSLGMHFVRITDRLNPEPPPLNQIRNRVIADWHRFKKKEILDLAYKQYRDNYTITSLKN